MTTIEEWAGWATAAVAGLGMIVQAVASHSRLSGQQRADRELLEQKIDAEKAAREAADQLADTRLRGWSERLKAVQAEQERMRDMAEKVGKLAVAVEGFGDKVAHAQELSAERIESLAERMADSQARTDRRLAELAEAIAKGGA